MFEKFLNFRISFTCAWNLIVRFYFWRAPNKSDMIESRLNVDTKVLFERHATSVLWGRNERSTSGSKSERMSASHGEESKRMLLIHTKSVSIANIGLGGV